jgi:hypothetical protein
MYIYIYWFELISYASSLQLIFSIFQHHIIKLRYIYIYIYIYQIGLCLVEVTHLFQPYVVIIRLAHRKGISTQLRFALSP